MLREMWDGWWGVSPMAVMVVVDFYLDTEQGRLPAPHPALPPVLPVWPALPCVGPEVPSVF